MHVHVHVPPQMLVVYSPGATVVMGNWQIMKTGEGTFNNVTCSEDSIVDQCSMSVFQGPTSGGRCTTGQASKDDSMWSSAHGLHSGPWLGPR